MLSQACEDTPPVDLDIGWCHHRPKHSIKTTIVNAPR